MSEPHTLFDAAELSVLVDEFEAYIGHPSRWSNRKMSEYRHRFAAFDIDPLLNANDLIAEARERLETPDWRGLAHLFGDRLVALWHESDFAIKVPPMHEWMGLTEAQYAAWVEGRYHEVLR